MEQPGRARRLAEALRRLDSGERIVSLARAGRRRLPGDHRYGDPLSLSGDEAPQLIGRGLAAIKLGGDYFGIDVNVAARVAAAAGPGEVLISDTVRARLDPERVATRRRWRFKPKGAPKGLKAFLAEPA